MSIEALGDTHTMRRTGWVMSAIVIVFFAFDAGATLLAFEPIKNATLETGYSLDLMLPIGVLALICLVLYAIPATCVLGAIVMTGYLGGAIATHLRVSGSVTPEMVLSLILGALAWGGLWFRDPRLRALIPGRRDAMPASPRGNVPHSTQ